jgi:hypothetical protein
MGSFPFADTSTSNLMSFAPGLDAGWSDAHRGAGWWCPNPPALVRRSAAAPLPLDDHHDNDLDSKCTRRRSGAAGARACAAALRLP